MTADECRMKNRLLFVTTTFCLCTAQHAMAMEVQFGGRLHLDYAAHYDDTQTINNHFLVRRAKLDIDGKFNEDWSFEISYDLTGVLDITEDGIYKRKNKFRNGFDDIALQYEGWEFADLTVGQFKVPFGLDGITSSNNISFIERALPTDAFGLSRRLGVGLSRNRDHYTVTAMGFGKSFSDDDKGHGAAARFTYTPIDTGSHVLHFGVSGVVEHPKREVKFNARPESKASDIRFVNTGNLEDIGRIDRIGLEAAWKSGPFSVQAEWMHTKLDGRYGRADAVLHGWYVMGSWILTGQSREYRNGRFKGIPASRSRGAWELTARYSSVDLDDAGVRGGNEENFTLGINYNASEHLRVMANYIKAHSARRGKTLTSDILLLRMQFAF